MAGRFITLEGGEGGGKSTQARRLGARLEAKGLSVLITREPGGSPGAEDIRGLLVNGAPGRWDALTETLLVYAARADHVGRTIGPALLADKWVVCDRFTDATVAYQGAGKGVGDEVISCLTEATHAGLKPDLTLVFDCPYEVSRQRLRASGRPLDRFEAEERAFFERVRQAYQGLAQKEPARVRLIDGSQPQDKVKLQVEKEIVGL